MAVKLNGITNSVVLDATSVNSLTLKTAANLSAWVLTFPQGPGTSGQVLTTNGSGVTSWTNASGGSSVVDDTTTNSNEYPVFVNVTSGVAPNNFVSSSKYTYNPALGQLSAYNVASTQGIALNANQITSNYTIPVNFNGVSGSRITVNSGAVVTAPAGSRWTVI